VFSRNSFFEFVNDEVNQAYARGLDTLLVTHRLLDMTPLGRQDKGVNWKFHDEYETKETTKACH
jgi:predicted dithiol-disulfide oxidoreductase (DUF899 family)